MVHGFQAAYGKSDEDSPYEQGYLSGHRRAWIDQASQALRQLYCDTSIIQASDGTAELPLEARVLRLEVERQEAIQALRTICAAHGDNDWPENLHLRDILEKHLERHLNDADD